MDPNRRPSNGNCTFELDADATVRAGLMAVPAELMALVQTDLQATFLVALGYLGADTLIGSILEPRIMGQGLGISTLAVFLSLLFWSWMLGTIGAFLSGPLTIALMIALDRIGHRGPEFWGRLAFADTASLTPLHSLRPCRSQVGRSPAKA